MGNVIDHVTLIHTKNIRMIEFYNIDFQMSFTLISETEGSFDKYIQYTLQYCIHTCIVDVGKYENSEYS